ncbi:MAG: ABC transporter ATP-binding protein [Ruminococcaceae bacterium]|nr:ABC transporter ATP-binding protein [Oscillospiraceae bacterium]
MGGGGGGLGKSRSLSSTVVDQKQTGADRVRVLRRMGKYLLRYPKTVILALFLMLSSNLLALAGPMLSGKAIDAIEPGRGAVNFGEVWLFVGLLIVFYAVSGMLSYILSVIMVNLSQRIIYTMRREVFEHLTSLPVGYFDTHQTGDIISHISYDIDTVNTSLSHDILQVLASIVTVVGALVMMLSISPPLVLVFAITIPISVLFTRYKTKRIRPLFKTRSRKLGELNGFAEEMLSGQKTIRAYSREDTIVSRFDARNNDAVEAYYKADWHGAMIGPSVNFINNLSIALVTVCGGILYMLTQTTPTLAPILVLSLGGVSAFVQYSRKFSGPINELANIVSELQSATAAAERVFRLIDEAPETKDKDTATALTDVQGEVDFSHVKFGYVEGKTILHDLTVHAKPGTTVAIVGPTGAGKTTVINLLMRFYDVNEGAVSIDGVDVRDATRRSLRSAFTMVLQDTWLFCGTIFENITYGKENATREEVIAAAKAAHIHDYIESLKDGYDTMLTDDGVNISKGQRQLITIARAMLADAPMLILDEATSNVDSRTEQQIQAAMKKLMAGRTCFVIAHRLSTIQNADIILVVKDGNVIEAGNHEALMKKPGGFYASLYNSQFT